MAGYHSGHMDMEEYEQGKSEGTGKIKAQAYGGTGVDMGEESHKEDRITQVIIKIVSKH